MTTSLDICHARCSAQLRCVMGSDEAACRMDCDQRTGRLQDEDKNENAMCQNAADLRRQLLDCYSLPCEEVDACVQPLMTINPSNPKCLKS